LKSHFDVELDAGGPIVMNTREELTAASCELDNGTFIKNTNIKRVNEANKFYQED